MRHRIPYVLISVMTAGTLALASCSEPTVTDPGDVTVTPPPPTQPGATILDVTTVSPIAQARTATSLRIQAFGTDGRPEVNVPILFQVLPTTSTDSLVTRVGYPNNTRYSNTAVVNTDGSGFASIVVVHSTKAGVENVRVSSSRTDATLDVPLTTLPGRATHVVISAADTVIVTGQELRITGRAADIYGNLRDDTIAFRSGSTGLTVTTGGIAVASNSGIDTVYAEVTSNADGSKGTTSSARIWVVPPTPLMYTTSVTPGPFHATVGSLRGKSDTTQIAVGSYEFTPAWQPAQNRVAYSQGGMLKIVEPATSMVRVIATGTAWWPEYSHDGLHIYYATPDAASVMRVYRVASDGTGVPTLMTPADTAEAPTLSPDGRFLAFASRKYLKVIDLQDGTIRILAAPIVNGGRVDSPRWSPDGQTIAFFSGGVQLAFVRVSDGLLTTAPAAGVRTGYSWSPDSKWLVGNRSTSPGSFLMYVPTLESRTTWMGANPAWQR